MHLLKRLLLIVCSLGIVFVLLEVLCRRGVFYSRAWEVHQEAVAQSSPGHLPVLIVGDSFSADDPTLSPPTFTSQLRKYLEERNADVLNIANPGFGPPEYLEDLLWYESYAPDFHPKLLMVNYYVGNDLHDTMSRLRGDQTRVELLHGFGSSVLQRSFLIQTLMELRRKIGERRQLGKIRGKIKTGNKAKIEAANPYLADLSNGRPQYLAESLLVEGNEAQQAWEENQRILRELNRYAKNDHAVLLVNILPHTLQVNKSHYEFFKDLGFQMNELYLTSTIPQDLMTQFCRREKILYNDLLPGFKERSAEEFYMDRDDHWNGAGFTLAFELVRTALERGHLLD